MALSISFSQRSETNSRIDNTELHFLFVRFYLQFMFPFQYISRVCVGWSVISILFVKTILLE